MYRQVKIEEWKTVFFIAAGFYLIGNLVFVIFGKAETQPWNEITDVSIKVEESSVQHIGKSHYKHFFQQKRISHSNLQRF